MRRPAPARRWRRGWVQFWKRARSRPRADAPRASRSLDHASACARQRSRGQSPRAAGGNECALESRGAHRRHLIGRTQASTRTSAACADHHARKRFRAAELRRSHDQLRNLSCVVVDEWHELLGTKRGVLLELSLSHLRALNPGLRVWGLSATLPNLDEALHALMGEGRAGRIIRAPANKVIDVDSVIPRDVSRFPWAGHMGSSLVPEVVTRDRGGEINAAVHQHARAGGDLVPLARGSAPRLAHHRSAASRLDRPQAARRASNRA